MKKFINNILLFSLLVICSSCESKGDSVGPDPDETPEVRLALIKLSPEMQEHVFVSPIVDSVVVDYTKVNLTTLYYGDGLVLCNPTSMDTVLAEFAQSAFKLLGTIPYIPLDNGYVAIDWKWAYFLPLSGVFRNAVYGLSSNARLAYSTNPWLNNGALANEEYYLLPIRWQELTDLNGIWEKKDGTMIGTPEVRYVKQTDLEKYAQIPTGYKEIRKQYDTENDLRSLVNLHKRDVEQFEAYVNDFNQLQSLYIKALNQMIANNNDFEKWTQQRQ